LSLVSARRSPKRQAQWSIFIEHGPDLPRKIFHGERLGEEIYVRIENAIMDHGVTTEASRVDNLNPTSPTGGVRGR
jgi:hypothetical protein